MSAAAWLGYIAAVVAVTGMVAVSFGGRATAPFVGDHARRPGTTPNDRCDPADGGVNLVDAEFVARAQTVIFPAIPGCLRHLHVGDDRHIVKPGQAVINASAI